MTTYYSRPLYVWAMIAVIFFLMIGVIVYLATKPCSDDLKTAKPQLL